MRLALAYGWTPAEAASRFTARDLALWSAYERSHGLIHGDSYVKETLAALYELVYVKVTGGKTMNFPRPWVHESEFHREMREEREKKASVAEFDKMFLRKTEVTCG